MKYYTIIRDNYGSEYIVGVFTEDAPAVDMQEEVMSDIISYVSKYLDIESLDKYYIKYPHKRFEVVVEVEGQ